MRKQLPYNLKPGLFTPLDLVTILYIVLSGLYMILGLRDPAVLWPHLGIRAAVLVVIALLIFLGRRFPNKVVLFFRHLYPLLFLSFFYGETSVMKNVVFSTNFDRYIFPLEQSLFGCQPSVEFSKIMSQVWFSEIMSMFYFSYYILTGIICVVFYLRNPAYSKKHVFTIVCSFYFFYIIFDLIPALGPQYYIPGAGLQLDTNHFFGKLMYSLIDDFESPTGAFPSSHVGMSVIVSLITFKHYRRLFYITLPFVLGICFATVYLREHYLVDVLAGLLVGPLLFLLSRNVYDRLMRASVDRVKE